MTSAPITPSRYPITSHICTTCKTRYAMPQDVLCGACAEAADEPDKDSCKSCGDQHGTYKFGNGNKMIRVQILGNGYCRACFNIRKEAGR